MEPIGGEVRRSLGAAGVPDAGLLAEVVAAWPQAVGPAIARAAWPTRIGRDGTLHVACTSAAWAFELGRLEANLRERLAAAVGAETPTALRFAPGPVPEAGPPEEPPAGGPTPTAEDLRLAAEIAAGVEDDRLRELVRRAAAASLAARPSGRRF